MRGRKLVAASAAVLLSGLIFAVPTSAEAYSLHDAKIKNHSKSNTGLEVCKNWIGYGGATCDYSQGVWYLAPGHRSDEAHWGNDTDAYRVPYGYKAKLPNGHYVGSGWHKLGGCGGCTITIRLYKA